MIYLSIYEGQLEKDCVGETSALKLAIFTGYEIILLLKSESFRVLLSCAN